MMNAFTNLMRHRKLLRATLKLMLPLISLTLIRTLLYAKIRSEEYFEFNSTKLQYFFHSYNNFRLTCRCIEIPIIKHYLDKYASTHVLEIGNVTKHYYEEFKDFKKKDTVDKYETAYDVINVDIKDFKSGKYDFIYSISTFEHMDSDCGNNPDFVPIESEQFSSHAFENLHTVIDDLLLDGGTFVVTFPLGQGNREIDNSLYNKEYAKFNAKKVSLYFLKQLTELTWKQIDTTVEQLAKEPPVCSPKDCAVHIVVMEITK